MVSLTLSGKVNLIEAFSFAEVVSSDGRNILFDLMEKLFLLMVEIFCLT